MMMVMMMTIIMTRRTTAKFRPFESKRDVAMSLRVCLTEISRLPCSMMELLSPFPLSRLRWLTTITTIRSSGAETRLRLCCCGGSCCCRASTWSLSVCVSRVTRVLKSIPLLLARESGIEISEKSNVTHIEVQYNKFICRANTAAASATHTKRESPLALLALC